MNYTTLSHRIPHAGMSLRKMSQYNRGSICYSHARKAVRTQRAANCTNTGVQERTPKEHQNHCHPQVTTGCITALLPSANLYCVPGAQATPQQLESQKSAPTRGGRGFPPILSPLSVLPKSGNTLLHGFKSLLLISQQRNIIGMQSRWICQTPTLQHDIPTRQSWVQGKCRHPGELI